MKPGHGGQLVRSAGGAAQLIAKEGTMAHVRLPSGEVRLLPPQNCRATVGQLSNIERENITIGKAGRSRWMRRRPAVRGGSAMNPPVDHPHGGGEGKAPIGKESPVTPPWGKPSLGYKTRKKNKESDRYIIKSRHN